MQERTNNCGQVIARVDVGTYVQPDGWAIGSCLKPGLEGFCDYYLPVNSGGPIKEVAVNVEITGFTRQWRQGDYYVRVRIIFVGDGEPNTYTPGWVPAFWG
jgi:hypothetical protein